jgi:hypothetical protein
VDAFGYLLDAVVYFLVTVGLAAAAVWRVDEKVAVPGTSAWRIRWPKVFVSAGPVLFVLMLPITLVHAPVALVVAILVTSLAAPWIAGLLIAVEWFWRRAEDRGTGLRRPMRSL